MNRQLHICKIASMYDHPWIGGAERQLALQVSGFVALGHRVDVITLAEPNESGRVYEDQNGARVHRLSLKNVYFPFGGARKSAALRALWHVLDTHNRAMASAVAQKLLAISPDVVVTHKLQGLSAAIWGAALAQGICTAHALHDHELICPATAMTRGDRLCETPCAGCACLSRARGMLSARPFAIVAPSHSILERHRRFGWFNDMPNTAVIENVLPRHWPQAPSLLHCNTPLRVGYIGRLEAAKGIDTLLDAAAKLPSSLLELRIAGEGESGYVETLRARYAELSGVHWLGGMQASRFYSDIDLLVVPSRAHESFCNVVMEAASLGIPAIVSDRGALPERIGNGRYGWSFPAGDAASLADILLRCAQDPQTIEDIGMRAIETRQQHRHDTVAKRYSEQLSEWHKIFHKATPASMQT